LRKRIGRRGSVLTCVLIFVLGATPVVAQTVPPPAPAAATASKAGKTKSPKKKSDEKKVQFPPEPCEPPPPEERVGRSNFEARDGFRDCEDTPVVVALQGGTFLMGDVSNRGLSYEQPVREVRIAPFAIGKFEVTWDEWDRCVAARVCPISDDEGWGRGRRPVINISWDDTQLYLAWLSHKTGKRYRLPSEAEWEYVAQAHTDTRFSWGEAETSACDYANVLDWSTREQHPNWFWFVGCDDKFPATAPVGSFKPNPWGLYDIHGNVWEWTQDCWHSNYEGAPTEGSAWIAGGDCSKRVNRGGGWGNHPRSVRASGRDADMQGSRGDAIGFRVVRELQ
jgi:formylglycine-generating enzyme required for sulfatase activity